MMRRNTFSSGIALCAFAFALAFAFCLATAPLALADEQNSDTAHTAIEGQAAEEAPQDASEVSTPSTVERDPNIVDPTQRADNSFIYDTSIGSLFDQASLYNERIVQVEGEAIGDRIIDSTHPGYCWITLTSMDEADSSTISVWISTEQADQIDRYGRYGVTGTHFQVRGTYHQACPDHEGLSDIHATASGVLAVGIDHPDEFDPHDFTLPLLLLFIGVVLLFAFKFVRERMR